MEAIVYQKKSLQITDVPQPKPSKNEVLIKILKAGICNTDLEILKGYMDFEGILGHEFVGQIVEAKNKKWIGKRVVGEINIGCGECEYCLSKKSNHCPQRRVIGIWKKDGVFTKYLTLPEKNLHLVPDSISDREAVFTEPLAAALQILDQINLKSDDKVLVLGDGKLGLLIAQVVSLTDVETFCLGKYERKLSILEKKGINFFFERDKISQKFDVIIEATGNKDGINHALEMIKPEGKIILKSTFFGQVNFDFSKIVINEISLIGSRCGPFDKALNLLKRKLINTEAMIDGDYFLNQGMIAFQEAQKKGTLKILISPS
ncbi:MAG: alcohol dehydrogenase catalytic domain-containing protein [Candidatus Aminicenantia bacterium]